VVDCGHPLLIVTVVPHYLIVPVIRHEGLMRYCNDRNNCHHQVEIKMAMVTKVVMQGTNEVTTNGARNVTSWSHLWKKKKKFSILRILTTFL